MIDDLNLLLAFYEHPIALNPPTYRNPIELPFATVRRRERVTRDLGRG